MTGFAKQLVLQGLARTGYVLLKAGAHQELLARAAQAAITAPPPPPPPPAAAPASVPFAPDSAFAAFRRTLPASLDVPERRILALYSAMQYLAARGIAGDVIDCAHANPGNLAVIAAALVFLEDTSRRLILCDPTADPLHRAERELTPWGHDYDLMRDAQRPSRAKDGETPPEAILASRYPRDRIMVWRYPREPIATSEPIAFLGLTIETYPANRTAIATFYDRLERGGVLAVEGGGPAQAQRDAVAEYLAARKTGLFLPYVADAYRMGIKT